MIDPQSPIDWLAARAAQTPDQLALIIGQRRWSYAELDRLTARLAGHLHDQGVKPGDFVAVLLPNSLEYVCLIHALARLRSGPGSFEHPPDRSRNRLAGGTGWGTVAGGRSRSGRDKQQTVKCDL
ncbi:MAG: AMP-binding protein [Ardenticatenaceae bacterium]|nr:AMP-binding protein [Ardenticatenaceae bacterium]